MIVKDIRDSLSEGRLLFDGAMGTYIDKLHPEENGENCELYNQSHPDWVQQVHERYLEAGAMAIKTNTFAAYPVSLSTDHITMEQIVVSGWKLATAAVKKVNPQAYIFADLGPAAVEENEEALEIYYHMINVFIDCGATCFLFETMESGDIIPELCKYIKARVKKAFILVSFGVSPEGFTRGGCFGRSLYYQMQNCPDLDAVGFNCVSGPKHLLELMQKLDLEQSSKYIAIMPNAGYPTVVANRTYYSNNHIYFADAMKEIALQGAAILGGCCGTEPAYTARMAQMLEEEKLGAISLQSSQDGARNQSASAWETGEAARNNPRNSLAAKLQEGQKVLVVELDPPMTPEVDAFMESAARLKKAGVDGIDIADCPIARARIDSSILACKVARELKMIAIPHMTCRDRNINATKALLLGLNIEGINNVLTVTGDPVPAAERQEVKTVFSYNSAVLARHINTLNETTFQHNPFQVSGALNINALNFDSQIAHAKKKIENGVSVLFTQPVMTEQGFHNLKRAKEELDAKILGGLIPVVSYRNACFMEHEIAGIQVDPRIIEAYKGLDREAGEELAVDIVTQIARAITPYIDGYYLITPFNRIGLMERIIYNINGL